MRPLARITCVEPRMDSDVPFQSVASSDSSSSKEKTAFASSIPEVEQPTRRGGQSPFVDAEYNSKTFRPIDTYEGAHRFDPDFEWSEAEENRLVRKIDLRICAFCCFTFFALQLDRTNITQAVAGNMLGDLNLITNQYNNGQAIFYVSFLVAELPSQLVSKWIGPDNWIPIQMVCWSFVAAFQYFLSGEKSFYVCRALLGLFEGGFIPDNILYLSYWYKTQELPRRLSWFWVAYQLTAIAGAFMAFGILHMNGVGGGAGWRWLYAIEGTLTGLIGIFAFFYMPPSVCQTASWFRGKGGWFSEHEEKILVNRILRDDPSKGDMHNRQAVGPGMLWRSLKDLDMWPIFLVGFTWLTPSHPMQQYLTLQLTTAGFGTLHTTLLTIPAYVLFIVNLLFWVWLSEKLNQRMLMCLAAPIWNIPVLIALETIPADASKWVTWALSSLVVGSPYIHPILVALTSRNAGSVRSRTVATAIYNMTVQAGSIIGTQIYRTPDAPMYRTGNKALIGLACWSGFVFIMGKLYYVRVNKKRAAKWDAMTPEQKQEYLDTTADQGNKRLDFRFSH